MEEKSRSNRAGWWMVWYVVDWYEKQKVNKKRADIKVVKRRQLSHSGTLPHSALDGMAGD